MADRFDHHRPRKFNITIRARKKKICVENDTPFFAVAVVHYATQAQAHLTIFLKHKE